MGLPDKSKGQGRGSTPIRSAQKPEYRGGKVCIVRTPLYLTETQEFCLDPNDSFDKGALEYFEDRKTQGDVTIEDINGRKLINITHVKNLNLADILNLPLNNEDKFLEDKQFDKYLPGPSIGIMPIGRTGREVYSHADFKADDQFPKRQAETLEGLTKQLIEHPYHFEAFSEAAMRWADQLIKPEDIAKFFKDNPYSFGKINTEYLFDKYIRKILPGENQMISVLGSKIYDMDHCADIDISRVQKLDDGNWKAQAWLLALSRNGIPGLHLIEDSSTHGSTLYRYGRNITTNDVINEQNQEKSFNASESHFRGMNKGTKPFKDCLTQYDGCVGIDMTKDKDPEEICGATHVKVLDLDPANGQYATITMGAHNPFTKRQSVHLTITQHPLGG